MADVDVAGDLPSLDTLNLATAAITVKVPARARAAYVIEAVSGLQYSFDGTTYADAPNAAGFLVWSRARASESATTFYLKLASGTATARLDTRDHL